MLTEIVLLANLNSGRGHSTYSHCQKSCRLLSPLHFRQVMHHFSQKIVTITNFLVFTYSFMLCALDQHKKTGENPPNLTYFHIQTPHPPKWAGQKSCRLIHSHVKTIVKKMHGELLRPPNHLSNPLQPPLVEVWIAGKENGDRQMDKVFCRQTPWVWQKCMENSGGTTFRWPVKLLRESNPTPNVCVC